jgi:O-antigen ligase
MGRGAALSAGWDALQSDPVTLLFGMGLGSRSESRTLGAVGIGQQGREITSNTGLLIMMQEMGIIGLLTFAGFCSWVILRMIKDIRRNPDSEATPMRYALVLFTIFWPLWLWYNTAWTIRLPMLFYWSMVAYTIAEASGFPMGLRMQQKASKYARA